MKTTAINVENHKNEIIENLKALRSGMTDYSKLTIEEKQEIIEKLDDLEDLAKSIKQNL